MSAVTESLFELITRERILLDLASHNKKDVLPELCAAIKPGMTEEEFQSLVNAVRERESLGSTGIGEGVAIPHGKLPGLDKIEICFARSVNGVAYESVDGRPVHLFFLMLAPEKAGADYLAMLARLSRFLKKERNRRQLLQAENVDEIARILTKAG